MNRLLLLATSLFCLSLEGYPAGTPQVGAFQQQPASDSSIKDALAHDPKTGFRDLFQSESFDGLQSVKLNPKAVQFVEDYMDSNGDRLNRMKVNGKPLFDKIDAVLTRYDLPVELKYLAVIESDLKSSATSRVGAGGPWQFMPETARDYGLKVNRSVDERRDLVKSTRAAAKYLNELYDYYGDWLLVIAAYNGGNGRVDAAIRKSKSRNFWDLQYHLPAESRNHVKKFIATHYIMEGDGGETTLTKNEREQHQAQTAASVAIPGVTSLTVMGRYNSIAITQQIGMSQAEFERFNPSFDRQLSANGTYELRLPQDKMSQFVSAKPQILEQSVRMLLSSVSAR